MRRSKQALSSSHCLDILRKATSGVLCLSADQGPYGVPMSYALFEPDRIYFHSAKEGEKISMVKKNSKACLTVIFRDDVQSDKLTTLYQSVIARGGIHIVQNQEEIETALHLLCHRYGCRDEKLIEEEIIRYKEKVLVLRMDIRELTGKQARELISPEAT